MNVHALGERLFVVNSLIWQTSCTVFDGGTESLVVDGPVFPAELESMSDVLLERGGNPEAVKLITTHGDWDHMFGRQAFPDAPLYCAESTARRLEVSGHELTDELAVFDEGFYVQRPALHLADLSPLSLPSSLEVGGASVDLVPTAGHTHDGLAVLFHDPAVLACGDYLSPLELPRVRGDLGRYFETLDQLDELVREVEWIVPGHGAPCPRGEALRILREDRDYLRDLVRRGEEASLPSGRDTGEMLRVHQTMNVPAASKDLAENPDLAALTVSRYHGVDRKHSNDH